MPANQPSFERAFSLGHAVATLAYRAGKALRNAPPGFLDFRPGEGSRSAGEILAHLIELMDWALSQASGQECWRSVTPSFWEKDAERFFASLTRLEVYLASDAEMHAPAEKIFQGAIADALTHVGQIAMLRRLANAPVRGENYSVAKIEAGRTGPDQAAPVREFD